ncbi:MAG: L,D-transpeptidase family protein [Actinomycetota bacterium]
MTRGKAVTSGLAATITAVAVVGGVAFGVDRLTEPGGSSGDPSAEVVPVGSEASSTPSSTPETEPSARLGAERSPAATVTPGNETPPEPTAKFVEGDSGDGVRELQARLKQIRWYETDITGEFDEVTLEAVEGFQAKRGLEPTGEVDEETWDRLVGMTEEPTEDEKHNRPTAGPTIIGPEESGDDVRELQARLKQIGWFDHEVTGHYGSVTATSVSGFQTKRGIPSTGDVDQRTWDLLVGMTRQPTDEELHGPPEEEGSAADGLPEACQDGRVLCIDKSSRTLRWVIDGDVQTTLDARFGAEMTPTREGTFSVYWKNRDHVSSLFDTPMPYAMFFDGGQAVHYSPDFAANGYNGASHGCVNIRDEGAIAAIFDQVNIGDTVYVYRS